MKFDFPFNLNYEWDSDGPSSIVIYLDDKYGSPWPIDKYNSSLFRFKVNTRRSGQIIVDVAGTIEERIIDGVTKKAIVIDITEDKKDILRDGRPSAKTSGKVYIKSSTRPLQPVIYGVHLTRGG